MAERQETIADIIAWLRRPREGENAYLTVWRDEIADRLEAARRREKAAIEADALTVGGMVEALRRRGRGDCAKLREALETMNNLFERGVICTSYANSAEEMEQIEELYRKTKSALAAPPRNCDRFGGDYKMLHTAWFDWTGSPSGQNADGTAKLTFAKWLLAPATEGGTK